MTSYLHALTLALALYAPPTPAVLSQTAPPAPTIQRAVPTARVARAECAPLTPDETCVLDLLNETRTAKGLRRLALDPTLTEVARAHCADMEKRNYFSHWEPDAAHRNPVDRYVAALGRRPNVVVGENLGTFIRADFKAIHEALMNSPTHRDNVLHPQYTYVGIGVLVKPDGHTWVTQMFRGGTERGGAAAVLPVQFHGAKSGPGVSPVLSPGTEKAG